MSEIHNISIVVPVFNEGQRIEAVLRRLLLEFDELLSQIIIIDDCSSDDTADVLIHLVDEWPQLKVFRNSLNLGHGPSIMKGLEIALQSGASHFLTYDGDGYLDCAEIVAGIRKMNLYEEDVVLEIIRSGRSDPGYRKIITFCLRLCVTLLTLKKVSDPNTPSRVVSRNNLEIFLEITSPSIPVPSLWFGIFARRNRFKIKEIEVSVEIESPLEIRNHWNSKLQFFPSARFVGFCLRAIRFWTWKK
jgi:dolichol-phosphate mannosyltransferase